MSISPGSETPPGRWWAGFVRLGRLRWFVRRVRGDGRGVRRESFAEQQKVLEAALVHHVEARLVAVEEGKFGADGEDGEGGGHAGALVTGRLGFHGFIE